MWIGVLWAGLRVAMWITHVGDFPNLSLSSCSAFSSTYKEHSRKGMRHNQDLSRKNGKLAGLENPRFTIGAQIINITLHNVTVLIWLSPILQ